MHHLDANKTAGEEARRQLHNNVASNIEQVLAATPQKAPTIRPPASHHENYTSQTNQTRRTLLEKQRRANKWGYSYGPPHIAEQKLDDQLEHTYSSYVRIRDVVLKTCQRRWTIGKSGVRGSGISVLAARHDDDDDIFSLYYDFKLRLKPVFFIGTLYYSYGFNITTIVFRQGWLWH